MPRPRGRRAVGPSALSAPQPDEEAPPTRSTSLSPSRATSTSPTRSSSPVRVSLRSSARVRASRKPVSTTDTTHNERRGRAPRIATKKPESDRTQYASPQPSRRVIDNDDNNQDKENQTSPSVSRSIRTRSPASTPSNDASEQNLDETTEIPKESLEFSDLSDVEEDPPQKNKRKTRKKRTTKPLTDTITEATKERIRHFEMIDNFELAEEIVPY